MLMAGSSCSPAATSSLVAMREAGAGDGDECCTTIEGVDATSGFLACVRRELRRERERASGGGGDLRRGETGQGELSPETRADGDFKGRGALIESAVVEGASWGMLAEERARWMAAAESPGELVPGPRLGLTSVLLLRERRPDWDLTLGPAGAVMVRCRPRAGEASRELRAELAGDGEPEALSERSRASDWRRMAGICVGVELVVVGAGAGAGAGACTTERVLLVVELSREAGAVGVGVGVVDDDDAGSADIGAPVML
jgi:hypothetical protein